MRGVLATGGGDAAWQAVRRAAAGSLYPVPPATAGGVCAVCRGPVRPGFVHCYRCAEHRQVARGLLADAVVPVSYAPKDSPFAVDLWRYKSWSVPDAAAGIRLRSLLLAFLHDHGRCVWRHAGMAAPGVLAVVPTGGGRPGPHPVLAMAAPYLRLPVVPLAIRPGSQGRDLDLDRFGVGGAVAGADVLLLDDTWVSGGSAQSAAVALRLAGARRVAVVVLGRHLNPADPVTGPLAAGLVPGAYDPDSCAAHRDNSVICLLSIPFWPYGNSGAFVRWSR